MNAEYWIDAVIVVILAGYLVDALIRPEKY